MAQCRVRERWRLAAIVLVALVVWLLLLPLMGRQRSLRAAIARCNAAGINPAALFYTEHDGYARWRERLDASRELLGSPGARPPFPQSAVRPLK